MSNWALSGLLCRVFGHTPVPTYMDENGVGIRVKEFRCMRCGGMWEVEYENEMLGDL